MRTTKKCHALSMQQRLDILRELEALKPMTVVAAKYRVHHSTIRRIKANAVAINEFAEKSKQQKQRRRLRKPLYEELEHRLYAWFVDKRTLGHSVTDALLLEKAVEFKQNMPSCSNFKASASWLAKFKRRNNIRLVNAYSEKSMEDQVTESVPVSERTERESVIKEEEFQEEEYEEKRSNNNNHQEHDERQEEIFDQADQDENDTKELKYIFERIQYHSARAPRWIHTIIAGLKEFFLGNRN